MKNSENIKPILLFLYFIAFLGFYLYLLYPILAPARGLTETKIPSYKLTELMKANQVFTEYNKIPLEVPTEPNINTFVFGQKDPI
jgi:hypothetical protein